MELNDLFAVTAEMIDAARLNPGGWVEKIVSANGALARRCETIVGAWKVDLNGCLTGLYIENPRYCAVPE